MSNSLGPHELQHARLPCPSLSPSNSWLLSQWCHPTISSSIAPFSSCAQSFTASGSFPMNRLFTSGGQSITVSASVLRMSIQGWFPLGLTRMLTKGTLKSYPGPQFESINSSVLSLLYGPVHICTWLLEKPALTRQTFVGKVMSLLFNTLSRFVIAFLLRTSIF